MMDRFATTLDSQASGFIQNNHFVVFVNDKTLHHLNVFFGQTHRCLIAFWGIQWRNADFVARMDMSAGGCFGFIELDVFIFNQTFQHAMFQIGIMSLKPTVQTDVIIFFGN